MGGAGDRHAGARFDSEERASQASAASSKSLPKNTKRTPRKSQQLLMNLIINAAEATGPNGCGRSDVANSVGVKWTRHDPGLGQAADELMKPGRAWFFSVLGTPPGMWAWTTPTKSKIFDPFFHDEVHRTRTRVLPPRFMNCARPIREEFRLSPERRVAGAYVPRFFPVVGDQRGAAGGRFRNLCRMALWHKAIAGSG